MLASKSDNALSLSGGRKFMVLDWAVFPALGEVTHEEETSSRQLLGKCGESVPGWFSY